jgi:hypothetical protein
MTTMNTRILKRFKNAMILTPLLLLSPLVNALDAPAGLVPAGLTPGDEFYIIFVTSTTTAGNSTVAQFNAAADAAGNLDTDTAPLTWMAIVGHDTAANITDVQSASLFAADNTQPIYNTNGDKVADTYIDFTDGTLDAAIEYDETGASVGAADVYTGLTAAGNALNIGNDTLGGGDSSNDGCSGGVANSTTGTFLFNGRLSDGGGGGNGCTDTERLYAVSALLTVAAVVPSVSVTPLF